MSNLLSERGLKNRTLLSPQKPTLIVQTEIQAPVQVCFDLARDITLHVSTAAKTKERAIAGVTSGLIGLGESVTFEGVHFGVRQRFTAKVTEFDFPYRFVDEMTQGAFKTLKHVHEFTSTETGTTMTDTLMWTSPFGIIGKLADKVFLIRHMERFLLERNAVLKSAAERAVSLPL